MSIFKFKVRLYKHLESTLSIHVVTRYSSSNITKSHWNQIPLAPTDKILGLNEAFSMDKFPHKVNLIVGAYRDDNGRPLVLQSVREAETRLFNKHADHEYGGIAGIQEFIDKSVEFAYGPNARVIRENRVAAIQSLSGTGACRMLGEFIHLFLKGKKKIFIPNPTWGNHISIMKNAMIEPFFYRYFNAENNSIDLAGMVEDISKAEEGSVFMLHACAHNPTGCDPTPAQWDVLSQVLKAHNHIIFFDCAYQGFASGDAEVDAYAIRKFVDDGHQIILAQSFAKNFGLYGERIGALSVVTSSEDETNRINSQLKALARAMYSNPPIYGARLILEILSDKDLKSLWSKECRDMAIRIQGTRTTLFSALQEIGSERNWSHIVSQIGMFCYSGLTPQQVLRLREDFHIYLTEDGRISMAGINTHNVDYVAKAIHEVTK